MSVNTVEGILHAIQGNPDVAARFQVAPGAMLADYPLSDDERRHILDWNVRALSDAGVNDMLLMLAFTAIFGQPGVPDYIRRMNMPPSAPSFASQHRGA